MSVSLRPNTPEFSVPSTPLGSSVDLNFTTVKIVFSKSSVVKRKEMLVYPLSSFVAEVGGTLGLLLGFSFLASDGFPKLSVLFFYA